MNGAQVQNLSRAEAWRAYEKAFHEFSEQVRRLQVLATDPHPDRAAIEGALLEVERSHVVYDSARDALARTLLPVGKRGQLTQEDSAEAINERVRTIAALLWETAGRPEGTADEDWLVAEQIVKRAAAVAA